MVNFDGESFAFASHVVFFLSVSLPFLCHDCFVFLKRIRHLFLEPDPNWNDVILCTVSNGHVKYHFNQSFCTVSIGTCEISFQSVISCTVSNRTCENSFQISANNFELHYVETKIQSNDKKTKNR